MDITALPSLTDIYEGADQWAEVLALLPVLVILELILSADNAVALAAIARASRNPEQERLALNIGIGLAMMLRVGLIALAQWVLQRAWVQLLAAAYLFWLFVNHLRQSSQDTADQTTALANPSPSRPLLQTVLLLGFTDLAFSIDSVAAAVAISDQLLLVISGALIGVIALRFTAGLFVRWLELYPRLETAGYTAVGFVGLKLILGLLLSGWPLPEWFTLVVVASLVLWGFSRRTMALVEEP